MEIDYAFKKCISNGTYGTISKVDNTTIKKTIKRYDPTSIIELCFLKTYTHPHFIKLKKYEIDDKHIHLFLEFGGINIINYINTVKNPDIINIFKQLVSVLRFMEINNIVHGDLSANNIIIDMKTEKVSIIDFGAVHFNLNLSEKIKNEFKDIQISLCTETVEPPENKISGVSSVFDTYSIGTIMKVFTNKNSLIDLMIEPNPLKRITPQQLILELKIKDELVFVIEEITGDYNKFYLTEINYKMISIVIKWLYDVCKCYNVNFKLGLAVYVLDKYIYIKGRESIKRSQLQLIGITCLKIVCLLSHIEITTDEILYLCKNIYKLEELKNIFDDILKVLDYKVYMKTFDQDIKNIDYNKVLETLLMCRNMKQEQLKMVYESFE